MEGTEGGIQLQLPESSQMTHAHASQILKCAQTTLIPRILLARAVSLLCVVWDCSTDPKSRPATLCRLLRQFKVVLHREPLYPHFNPFSTATFGRHTAYLAGGRYDPRWLFLSTYPCPDPKQAGMCVTCSNTLIVGSTHNNATPLGTD